MINKLIYISVILLFLVSCGARIKQPFKTEEARIGENTTPENEILKGVERYLNGVLVVDLPKREELKPKQIQVKVD